ncbi:MAG: HDOD domain-containing protein, partial [Candidatus Methylophosphatis roskildensis]
MIATEIESPALDELLSCEPAFPNIPRVVALVVSEANRSEPDLRKLSQWIGSDPGLAARALQMANSSKFRLSGKIGGVSEALAVLGPTHLRSLAQAAATGGAHRSVPGIQLQTFWRYSLNT